LGGLAPLEFLAKVWEESVPQGVTNVMADCTLEEVRAVLNELLERPTWCAACSTAPTFGYLNACGCGLRTSTLLLDALACMYPGADRRWAWQWVLSASSHYVDRHTGVRRRHHLHESVIHRAMKEAVRRAGFERPASSHSLRHSFATHVLEDGYDIRFIQERLGYKEVKTTMVLTHVLNRGGKEVRSPIDAPGP